MNASPSPSPSPTSPDPQDLQAQLAHCAAEAIHTPETIQSYGTLVVCLAATGHIRRHSENATHWLGGPDKPLLGQRLPELLNCSDSTWQEWVATAQLGINLQLANIPLPGQPGRLEIMGHRVTGEEGELVILELIPDLFTKDYVGADVELLGRLARSTQALRTSDSVEAFTHSSVQAIRDFLGYDRVMLYRFAPDWSGEVLAEATAKGVEPRFIGQRFPASDIPVQARELYTRNLLRVIADVDAPVSALVPARGEVIKPLDQSHCLLRQPSPMHLIYLRNMGVRATVTISLMHEGKLWGMLTCHHHSPRIPPQHHRYSVQVACELIADGLVSRLDALLRIEALEHTQRMDRTLDKFDTHLRAATSMASAWALLHQEFIDLVNVDSVFGRLNGQRFGDVGLSERALFEVKERLRAVAPGTPVFTDSVRDWGWQPQDSTGQTELTGLLAVSPSGDDDTYIVALRPEWKHSIGWGGRPDRYEPVDRGDGVAVLGPRRSFDLWLQDVQGRSHAWSEREVDTFVRLVSIAARHHARAALQETRERDRLLGASLDLIHDMVVVTEASVDPTLGYRRITYVNPALCEQSGYTREELIGQSPSIFQGHGTESAAITRMSEALTRWQPVTEKLMNYKKDGTPYCVELKIVPVADETGWFTHWISIQRDITQTVRLEKELQSKNDRLESVLRATAAGTWSLDIQTRVGHLDGGAAALLGYKSDQYSDVNESELLSNVHPDDVEQLMAGRDAHLQKKTQFFDVLYRLRHKEGHWVWISSRGQVVHWTPEGQPALMIGTLFDVSESVALRYQVEAQQRFLADLTDRLPGAVYQFTRSADGRYAMPFASRGIADLLRLAPEDVYKDVTAIYSRLSPLSLAAVQQSTEDSARDLSVLRHRFQLEPDEAGNAKVTLQVFSVPQAGPDGSTVWYGFMTDVSDVVRIEEEILQTRTDLEATIAAIPDPLISLDSTLIVNLVHSPQPLVWGHSAASLRGRKITSLLGEPALSIFTQALQHADQNGHVQNVEFPLEIDGVVAHFECSIACKRKVGAPQHSGYVLTIRDVTQRRQTEQQVSLLAYHDPLTGLLNRRALLDRLERIHAQSRERHIQYAVLFIDLDNFKDLNDAHGHYIGDDMLRQVATRLGLEIRHTDIIARLGGDEFLVVIPDLLNPLQAQGVAMRTAQSLIQCMKPCFELGELHYEIACSIGVAFGPGEIEAHQVMQHADIAMYHAKASDRDGYHFFDTALQSEITSRSALEQDLRHAIDRDELLLFYQPIVGLDRAVVGYEALIRWKHPVRGMVPPVDFIPAAEHNGLIIPIGAWVLQKAVAQLLSWSHDTAQSQRYISVNVSALQVQRDDFVETTRLVLERSAIDPRKIRLELTESLMHTDIRSTIAKMQALRDLGVEFALDDFGTGYSSMSYIRQLPLHQLKIDRSFIVDLPEDKEGAAIATMITQLATTLRLGVVAEGVETEKQFDYLKSLGCQYFQGYYFGKPTPMESL